MQIRNENIHVGRTSRKCQTISTFADFLLPIQELTKQSNTLNDVIFLVCQQTKIYTQRVHYYVLFDNDKGHFIEYKSVILL